MQDCPGVLNIITEPRQEVIGGVKQWRMVRIAACNQAACPFMHSVDEGPAAGPFTFCESERP
jgi:hypothetical protein